MYTGIMKYSAIKDPVTKVWVVLSEPFNHLPTIIGVSVKGAVKEQGREPTIADWQRWCGADLD